VHRSSFGDPRGEHIAVALTHPSSTADPRGATVYDWIAATWGA
jgi:hypothetical protein